MADLTLTPNSVYEETLSYKTLVSTFENGTEQRRAKWGTPLRKFRLEYMHRTETEFETLRDFFITKKGSLTAFTWNNINDATDYTVRFEEDSFSATRVAYDVYNFSCVLVEAR